MHHISYYLAQALQHLFQESNDDQKSIIERETDGETLPIYVSKLAHEVTYPDNPSDVT